MSESEIRAPPPVKLVHTLSLNSNGSSETDSNEVYAHNIFSRILNFLFVIFFHEKKVYFWLKQARKGFRPLSAMILDIFKILGIFWEFFVEFFGKLFDYVIN